MATVTHPARETWDLSRIYESEERFERAREGLEAALPRIDRWRGRLGEGAATLAAALDEITDAYREFYRLRSYASMLSDLDTRVAAHQGMRQRVDFLGNRISTRFSFVRPEILALDPATVERFLDEEPKLACHAFFLRDLVRQRAHVLSPPEERILAEAGLVLGSAPALYGILNDAELPRPEVELHDGARVRLEPVEFHRHRASQHRGDRQTVFPAYFGAYRAFRDTLGQNVYSVAKAHLFRARTRGYPSCVAAALDRDNVPVDVYRNLIRQVRERLPLLHRYLALRARALGLERIEYPDLYCPLIEAPPTSYGGDEARRLITESLAPLGESYVRELERAFEDRWIDWHPCPGKRSGAYANGWAYDVHPFVLLNFTGNFESVSTLAHEMGHAMHSWFSNRTQPFATADYSIFVAEVASTLNETLLARRMIEIAPSDTDRLYLVASHVDSLRGTLFRQAMFAEFELEIHERTERGEALTGERLDEIYLGLLRDYHGHGAGVANVADEYAIEWASIPHFYYDFYVYQYATGVTAATALAEGLVRDGDAAVRRYHEFLNAGGSDYPLELLRRAGVDLESSEPYDATFDALEGLLDRLESLMPPDAPRR